MVIQTNSEKQIYFPKDEELKKNNFNKYSKNFLFCTFFINL